MRYVGPRGIPLDGFLSWPQESQNAVLTWQGHEAARCGGCGVHPDEGPMHTHVEICLVCAAKAAAATETKDVPGAHVLLAPGTRGDCPKCLAEMRTTKSRGR